MVPPATSNNTSRDDFEKHGYYKFHAKYGIGRSCMVGFSSQDDLLCLTLHRKLSQNFFDEEETAVLKVMRDRLNVSATMMRHLSQTRVTGMSDAFEMAGTAAIFFNRFSKITHVNTTAAKLLGRELQVVRGEMRSINREETARIRERMKSVISERWLQPGSDAGPLTVRREGRRPIVMRIQRLGGNLPDFFAHSVGVCLLEDPEVIQPTATQTLRQLFGLTPTEARLVASLSEGLSLKEIAERSFQSYQTVRTHLKSIFSKTETGRQAELVALVARLKAAREISDE